jgi:hypothetical protein
VHGTGPVLDFRSGLSMPCRKFKRRTNRLQQPGGSHHGCHPSILLFVFEFFCKTVLKKESSFYIFMYIANMLRNIILRIRIILYVITRRELF